MEKHTVGFDLAESIHELKHYLPAQAALKDFVHHNTLHAFQKESFHEAIWMASQHFGYTTYLAIDEFRAHFANGRIREEMLNRVIADQVVKDQTMQVTKCHTASEWKQLLLEANDRQPIQGRLGQLRRYWKTAYDFGFHHFCS